MQQAGLFATFAADCWKKTALGSPIRLEASRPLGELARAGERPIAIIGGVHGDEPEGVELATRAVAWLRAQDPEKIAPWVAIPVLNVDGFARGQRVNGRGVDLNRNYPARDWSAACEKPRYNPGASAGSEPETQAVAEIVRALRPRLLIHCHSWDPCIVFTGEPGRADAERLARSCGYEAKDHIGYPTPGSLSSFGWRDCAIPVICIEERDGLADLAPVWPRFAAGFAEIFADRGPRGADVAAADVASAVAPSEIAAGGAQHPLGPNRASR
jgi:hypothetical protein